MLKRRKVTIACIQETRWRGQKSCDIGNGYKLSYYGTSNSKGVAIAVNIEMRNHIAEVQRHSDRLISAVIDCETRRLHVFSAYAPQCGCKDEEKEQYWTDKTRSQQFLRRFFPLGGDLTGHVGIGRHEMGYAAPRELRYTNCFLAQPTPEPSPKLSSDYPKEKVQSSPIHQNELKAYAE
ncbi:hypothetical protein OSTOST_25885 [Ostertagia ostertagi]